ncbi:MAG: universal stress protein [Terriglobales bacterium]
MAAAAPKFVPSLKLRNILFATDFSPCSENALPYARVLAQRFGSTIHVLHVLPPEAPSAVPMDRAPLLDEQRQVADNQMSRLLLRQPLKNVTHEVLIERGPLWHVLEAVIKDRQIDLIVLGTHGRRGLKKLVLGSVAEEIFRRATCPVLTIGPHVVPDGVADGRIDCVLYATDFSHGSMHALPYAVGLARENHSRIVLLHVLPCIDEVAPQALDNITESCRQQLLNLLPPAMAQACHPEAVVLFGAAAEAILRIAAEQRARLIVMGARRRPMVPALVHLPWATAHRVVCEAPCPVLTVRS